MSESLLEREGTLHDRWASVARAMSAVLVLASAVIYASTFTKIWVRVSDTPLICVSGCIFLLIICNDLVKRGRSDTAADPKNGNQSNASYSAGWVKYFPYCALVFVLAHWFWLYRIAPSGYSFMRASDVTGRHARDFIQVLSPAEYEELRSVEVRSGAAVLLMFSVGLAVRFYFDEGKHIGDLKKDEAV